MLVIRARLGEASLSHVCVCVCSIGEKAWLVERDDAVAALPPGSLAGLVDLGFDVLDGGQLRDAGLWLLVGHLGGGGGEVLIALQDRQTQSRFVVKRFCTWVDLNTTTNVPL